MRKTLLDLLYSRRTYQASRMAKVQANDSPRPAQMATSEHMDTVTLMIASDIDFIDNLINAIIDVKE